MKKARRRAKRESRTGIPWLVIPIVAFALVIAGVVAVSVLTDETQDPLQAGDEAPLFALPDGEGDMVDFGSLLEDNQAVALIFYRGFG